MQFDFEFFLAAATALTGIIILFDKLFFAKKRAAAHGHDKLPAWIESAYSFFPVLLLVLLFRSFVFEPFRIPSSSLEPTLLIGDFILVNKFDYGLRFPVLKTKFYQNKEPQTGEIVVFRYPNDPSKDYIKRVIGVPGDHITYHDKVLKINDKEAPQELEKFVTNQNSEGMNWQVALKHEDLLGTKHSIYQRPDVLSPDQEVVVPPGQYFVMGDNRDDSNDSRVWGFVPEENLIGRAVIIWFSWDNIHHTIRWNRIGKSVYSSS